jgi:hypothetical protein
MTLFFIQVALMLMLEYLKPCSQKMMLCSLMSWIMLQSLMGYDCVKQESIATDIWTHQVIIFLAGCAMLRNVSFCRSPCCVQYMFCKKSLKIVTSTGLGKSCVPIFCLLYLRLAKLLQTILQNQENFSPSSLQDPPIPIQLAWRSQHVPPKRQNI